MFIAFSQAFTPADAEGGGSAPTLPCMVCLVITIIGGIRAHEPLFLSHALSPVVRSLRLTYIAIAPSHLLGFIYSFTLLQDLSVIAWLVDACPTTTDGQQTSFKPSKSPAFIGSLEHLVVMGMGFIISRHFLLPNGPYFRRPRLTYLTTHVTQLPAASSPLLLCAWLEDSPIKNSWSWTAPPPDCVSRTRSV